MSWRDVVKNYDEYTRFKEAALWYNKKQVFVVAVSKW